MKRVGFLAENFFLIQEFFYYIFLFVLVRVEAFMGNVGILRQCRYFLKLCKACFPFPR